MDNTIPAQIDEGGYSDNAYEVSQLLLSSNSGGKAVDLRNIYREIVIYETVFDDKMYGEIIIADAVNLSESMPIVGNESILIEYKTRGSVDSPVRIVGKVVAPMGKARTPNEKMELYKVQFVSDLQFRNRFTKVHASYSGSIVTNGGNAGIANQVFLKNFGDTNSDKFFTNDSSIGRNKFVIPYWNPIFTMTWLAQRAVPATPGCFLFYEDVDGFHFKNLTKEIEKQPKLIYRIEPMNAKNLGDVMGFMTRVQDYSVTSFFDRLEEYSSGMYSGTLYTHDITTKKFSRHSLNYFDELYPQTKHLNKNPLFPAGTVMSDVFATSNLGFRNIMPIQKAQVDGIVNNHNPEKYYLNRNSINKQFTTLRMTIVVPGNSSLRLLDVVGLEVPKSGYMDESDSEWQDGYLSGRYVIVSLKTVINKTGYRTTVELSKDSLVKGIPSKYEESGSDSPI